MSNDVINPLLDAAIIQLNALKNLVNDASAALLIDGAKAQVAGAKVLLGGKPPELPAPVPVREPEPLTLRPTIKCRPAPKTKTRKPYTRKDDRVSGEELREAVMNVVTAHDGPVKRRVIEAELERNPEAYGLNGSYGVYSIKEALKNLVHNRQLRRTGKTTNIRYELP